MGGALPVVCHSQFSGGLERPQSVFGGAFEESRFVEKECETGLVGTDGENVNI